MAALRTRAHIQAQGDYSLCPLSALHVPPSQLQQDVEAQRAQANPLVQVERLDEEGTRTCIAQGYEAVQSVTAAVDGESVSWQERRLLVQSMAATQAAQASLHKAQQALQDLTARRRGKARLQERAAVQEAVNEVLRQFHVEGLLSVQIHEQVQERPVRAYGGACLRYDVT